MRVHCPLCGPAEASRWRRQGSFRAVRCRGCGLGITWPPPTAAQLEEYYARDYYERDRMGADTVAGWPARAEAILGRLPGPVARALDFGAGQGHLVAALRARGIEAVGVEPLGSGREEARRLHGLDLLADWPDPAAAPFDLVTAIHSLEHVPDPPAVLEEAARRVRAGGFLLVDVPHAATFELLRPRRRREVLCLPGHLFHFTPGPLSALLERAGFGVVAVHLTNPDLLEWAFGLRARLVRRRAGPAPSGAGPASAGASAPAPASAAPGRAARLWRALLPRLRARFPGYRFELVARRRGPEGG